VPCGAQENSGGHSASRPTRTAYLSKSEEAAGRLWKLKALGVDLHDLDAEDLIVLGVDPGTTRRVSYRVSLDIISP
jgi:hypothetical protein